MPKYCGFKVCDHILYFTTHCTVEAMREFIDTAYWC